MHGVITQKLCGVNETDDIIKELFKTFLDNDKEKRANVERR